MTQIAADKGWRIREVRPERASAVWSSCKARPGLWVGMALALLMLVPAVMTIKQALGL